MLYLSMAMDKKGAKKGMFYTVHVIEKSLIHHVIEWVATLFSVFGSLFNANLLGITAFNTYTSSFYLWFVGDILWIMFAIKHKHWSVLVTFSIFAIINLLAIIKNLGIM